MNRVTKRTWLMAVFVGVLLGGLLFFLWEYTTKAGDWIASGSINVATGTITDRSGTVLLDMGATRTYSSDPTTRKSTLHWLGDRNGSIKASAVNGYRAEMAGFDLVNGIYNSTSSGGQAQLTLSAKVQNTAYQAMDGRKGVVAVYNYKTGEILCAVTTPTFDPDNVPDIAGDTSGTYEGVYLNRFLQSAYIPGSIFKVVTTGAALESVPDILGKTFTCTGSYGKGEEKVTCEKAHGTLDLKGALAHSCNCSFAQIAELVGRKSMEKYVEQFQVTQSLTIDGVTTAKGNYDISDAGSISFAWSCIGQHTDQINPARFMTFMGAIAAGGKGAEPYIMESVYSGDSQTYQAKTTTGKRIMSEDTAETLKSYLRNNVQTIYGAGNFPGLTVCAKSGTSQLGGGQKSNAMFAGFVDDEAYPLAFIVVVENGGYGSATCVPIISKVLAACKTVLDSE